MLLHPRTILFHSTIAATAAIESKRLLTLISFRSISNWQQKQFGDP
ncbi:MAG: hypothetical protein F6J93_11750 [Oscillatoria sp. SIO1A7]|nr:hypothetical protein [Oscillatoria sp. SIO1A7]